MVCWEEGTVGVWLSYGQTMCGSGKYFRLEEVMNVWNFNDMM